MFQAVLLILAAAGILGSLYGIFVEIKKDKPLYESWKGLCKIFCTSLGIVLLVVFLLIIFS